MDGFKWCLTNVYGSNRLDERTHFFDELNALTNFFNVPWCIGGVFNVIRWPSDSSVNPKISPCMHKFNSFIRNDELLDIPSIGAAYTYLSKKCFRSCPSLVEFDGCKVGPSPFIMELNWLPDRSFIKLVEEFWQNTIINGWVGHQFTTKLKMLKHEICKWKKESWGNLQKKIAVTKKKY
ncbi:hypothetical protein AMTRI_Chr12g237600 [Amborella trichopoda]